MWDHLTRSLGHLFKAAKSDEWLEEKDAGTIPGLQVRANGFEKVGASAEGAVASMGGMLSSMGLTRVLLLFMALMAAFRWLSSLIGDGGPPPNSRRQEQQRTQQQQQQQQQRERQQRQRQEEEQKQQQREYRQQQQQQQEREQERARREANQSANGAARGGNDQGARQRPAAAQKMFNDLSSCSVRQLRDFAESHKINISDCSEKSEIVAKILAKL